MARETSRVPPPKPTADSRWITISRPDSPAKGRAASQTPAESSRQPSGMM